MQDIEFNCSQCGQSLAVEAAGGGRSVECPQCGSPLFIPPEGSQQSLAAEEAAPNFKPLEESQTRSALAYNEIELTAFLRSLAVRLRLEIERETVELIVRSSTGTPVDVANRLRHVRDFGLLSGTPKRITLELAAEALRAHSHGTPLPAPDWRALTAVPGLKEWYPAEEDMDAVQRSFYRHLVDCIGRHQFPSVDGNVGYLFAYANGLLAQCNISRLYGQLLDLASAYSQEAKFAECCMRWSYDCLLAVEKYDDFLLASEPQDVFSVDTHLSNLRCNVCRILGKPARGVDLVRLFGVNVTSFTKQHANEFRDFIEAAFEEEAEKSGPWLERLLAAEKQPMDYGHNLFQGSRSGQRLLGFSCFSYYAAYELADTVQEVVREAENRLRDEHGETRVGEQWPAETALFHAVKQAFPQTQVVQHGRPDWLGRQHLDIWIPHWKIAVEHHGPQHFEPVKVWGGISKLEEQKRRDARKALLCAKNGVDLIVVKPEVSHEQVIENIKQQLRSKRLRVCLS